MTDSQRQAGASGGPLLSEATRPKLLREFERLVGEWDQSDGAGGHRGLALRLLRAVYDPLRVEDN